MSTDMQLAPTPGLAKVKKPKRRPGQITRARRETRTALTMLLPSFIGVGFFLILPIFLVFALSFTDWDLLGSPSFIGLENYQGLIGDSQFLNALWVTVKFSFMAIPVAIASGLLIALGLNRGMPGSSVIQLFYVLPWVAAPLALGVVWNWLLDPRAGAMAEIFGINKAYLADPKTALIVVAFVYVWQNVGYISLFFLAGLQTIPKAIYEAASLDGASGVRMLFSITLPLVMPTMFFVSVTSFISSFQIYDLVVSLTSGNPGYPGGSTDVIASRIYSEAFVSLNIGEASAMAMFLTVVIVGVTIIQQRFFSGRLTYDMS